MKPFRLVGIFLVGSLAVLACSAKSDFKGGGRREPSDYPDPGATGTSSGSTDDAGSGSDSDTVTPVPDASSSG